LAYGVRLRVFGAQACFTRPGTGRVSYEVMTPWAARGVLEAIHWKPAIRWIVQEIHILAPVRFHAGPPDGTGAKILADVDYLIAASFEVDRLKAACDNAGQHLAMFRRRARKGRCFHTPCLGGREFPARFALVEPDETPPAPIGESRDLGDMLYDIDHAAGRTALWFRARLEEGVLRVPRPGSPEIRG
jgi:CRISPR-associated protein Cas5d